MLGAKDVSPKCAPGHGKDDGRGHGRGGEEGHGGQGYEPIGPLGGRLCLGRRRDDADAMEDGLHRITRCSSSAIPLDRLTHTVVSKRWDLSTRRISSVSTFHGSCSLLSCVCR